MCDLSRIVASLRMDDITRQLRAERHDVTECERHNFHRRFLKTVRFGRGGEHDIIYYMEKARNFTHQEEKTGSQPISTPWRDNPGISVPRFVSAPLEGK